MELTLEAKTKPCSLIFKVGASLQEIEETKVLMDNLLDSMVDLLDNDTGSSRISHLQAPIPLYRQRIADLTDSIGVAYFSFDSQQPYSYLRPRVSLTNSIKTRRGRTNIRRVYLSPLETSTLCGGLTDGQVGGNCATQRHALR